MTETILVGTCGGHHQHLTGEDRLRMIHLAREAPGYVYREGIHVVAVYHTT